MRNYLAGRRNDLGFNFFDDMMEDFFRPVFFHSERGMKTDVREKDGNVELYIDMPGFEKKDINLTLSDGYLTVSAKREEKSENQDGFTRRERSVSCQRSYFIGDAVTEEDVKAKYENGTLSLFIPKKEKKELPKKHIEID